MRKRYEIYVTFWKLLNSECIVDDFLEHEHLSVVITVQYLIPVKPALQGTSKIRFAMDKHNLTVEVSFGIVLISTVWEL